MGYRSDVKIAIYGDAEKLTAIIAAHRMKGSEWVTMDETQITGIKRAHPEISKPQMMIYAEFYATKWDSFYSDVRSWAELIDEICDLDNGIAYEFARVGEDHDDIDYEYGGHDVEHYLNIVSEIIIDMPEAA